MAEEGFLVACRKAPPLFSFKTKEESLTIITTRLLAPQASLSPIFLPILHSYVCSPWRCITLYSFQMGMGPYPSYVSCII